MLQRSVATRLSTCVAFAAMSALAACSGGSSVLTPVNNPGAGATASPGSGATATPAASPSATPAGATPTPKTSASPTSAASATPSAAATATATPSPAPTGSTTANPAGFTVTGATGPSKYAAFDAKVKSFMQQYGIRAGQVAVGMGGSVVYSHAYTNTTDPAYTITQPTSIFRVSSNSKAFETAAVTKLYAAGKLSPSTLVWPLLSPSGPLLASQTVDPRTSQITVAELVNHTAGYHDDTGSDPAFNMYSIEQQAGNSGPLTQDQFVRYLYGYQLDNNPGATSVYSNDGYFLLARVIEKAAGMPYKQYIDANVLSPIGVTDDVVTATAQSGRLPNEATCDDPSTGYSVLTPMQANIVPGCYGGITVYEVLDGPTSMSISAQSLVKFAGNYNVYGLGARAAGYAREGSFVGSISWMESLNNGYDFSFSFNDRVDQSGNAFDITPLSQYFEQNVK